MDSFAVRSLSIVLAACGGKVVVDQPAIATGASGGSGGDAAASSGSASASSGADCAALLADYNAKVGAAQQCSPSLDVPQCKAMVPDTCGCPDVPVNQVNETAVEAVQAAYTAWSTAGCTAGPGDTCFGSCQMATGFCQPKEDGTGVCWGATGG